MVFPDSEWVLIGTFDKSYPDLFPASPEGHSCRKSPTFFDPTWSNTVTILDRIKRDDFFDPIDDCNRIWPGRIEKVLKVISCNCAHGAAGNKLGPRIRGKQLWIDLGGTYRQILRRGRTISIFLGEKAHSNILKLQKVLATFSGQSSC